MSGQRDTHQNSLQPRAIKPVALPRLGTLEGMPTLIEKQFDDIRAPEPVVAARKECAYRFLEEVYLPDVQAGVLPSCTELAREAREFKRGCLELSIGTPDDFDLISSIEVKLELLQLVQTLDPGLSRVIAQAFRHLRHLLENCPDDLLG